MHIINIFIPGTLPPNFIMKISVVHRFLYCLPGLTLARNLGPEYHMNKIARTLAQQDAQRFPLDTFYLFGWSGALNFKARQQAADSLYSHIKHLVKSFAETPYIRIITHSHGGNVALNLARSYPELELFTINELILLGCPVQEATRDFVNAPLFGKIYSFHSHIDLIQVLDPQGLSQASTSFFSHRHFPFTSRVLQVNLTLNKRNLFHLEFLMLKFFTLLPQALTILETQYYHHVARDIYINITR